MRACRVSACWHEGEFRLRNLMRWKQSCPKRAGITTHTLPGRSFYIIRRLTQVNVFGSTRIPPAVSPISAKHTISRRFSAATLTLPTTANLQERARMSFVRLRHCKGHPPRAQQVFSSIACRFVRAVDAGRPIFTSGEARSALSPLDLEILGTNLHFSRNSSRYGQPGYKATTLCSCH